MDHFFNELCQVDRYQIIVQLPDGQGQKILSKSPFQALSVGQTFGYGKHMDSDHPTFKVSLTHRQITDTPEGLVDSITLILENIE